jgi:hypothetical protein
MSRSPGVAVVTSCIQPQGAENAAHFLLASDHPQSNVGVLAPHTSVEMAF